MLELLKHSRNGVCGCLHLVGPPQETSSPDRLFEKIVTKVHLCEDLSVVVIFAPFELEREAHRLPQECEPKVVNEEFACIVIQGSKGISVGLSQA